MFETGIINLFQVNFWNLLEEQLFLWNLCMWKVASRYDDVRLFRLILKFENETKNTYFYI